jgi:hypothetical protein
LAFGFFIATNAGEDSGLIGLLALRGQARHAGTPLIAESLDVVLFERDQGRAGIDHAADRGIMAFPKSRNPEEMAEGVVGHGRSNVTSKKSNGRAKHTGAVTCREVPTNGSHQPFACPPSKIKSRMVAVVYGEEGHKTPRPCGAASITIMAIHKTFLPTYSGIIPQNSPGCRS